jgi:hypothetical protein
VGRLAMRSAGTVGAIVAAAVYATHPAAVLVERGPFLEPLLNLCCLCLAWVWLAGAERRGWHTILAGVLCGLAISVKAWGVFWLAACVLSGSRHRSRSDLMAFVAIAAMTCLVLCAPLALAAPMSFFSQVFSFHLHRPPDGPLPRLDRPGAALWMHGQLLKSALVAGGLILALTGSRDASRKDARFFAAAFILILAAFLVSSAYWAQYNGHLAVPESWLAGFAAAGLWRWAERNSNRVRTALALGLVAAVLALGARRSIATGLRRSPDLVAVGQFIRSKVPTGSYVVSFEPAWTVAGGRLPDRAERPIIVDSYATMLIGAASSGRHFSSAAEAFRDSASQRELVDALRASRFAIIGDRGYSQMSPDTRDWLRTGFVQRFPPPGREGIDVWERAP